MPKPAVKKTTKKRKRITFGPSRFSGSDSDLSPSTKKSRPFGTAPILLKKKEKKKNEKKEKRDKPAKERTYPAFGPKPAATSSAASSSTSTPAVKKGKNEPYPRGSPSWLRWWLRNRGEYTMEAAAEYYRFYMLKHLGEQKNFVALALKLENILQDIAFNSNKMKTLFPTPREYAIAMHRTIETGAVEPTTIIDPYQRVAFDDMAVIARKTDTLNPALGREIKRKNYERDMAKSIGFLIEKGEKFLENRSLARIQQRIEVEAAQAGYNGPPMERDAFIERVNFVALPYRNQPDYVAIPELEHLEDNIQRAARAMPSLEQRRVIAVQQDAQQQRENNTRSYLAPTIRRSKNTKMVLTDWDPRTHNPDTFAADIAALRGGSSSEFNSAATPPSSVVSFEVPSSVISYGSPLLSPGPPPERPTHRGTKHKAEWAAWEKAQDAWDEADREYSHIKKLQKKILKQEL